MPSRGTTGQVPKQTTPCGPIAPQELQAFFILLAVSKLMLLAYACSIIRVTVHGCIQPPRPLHGGAVVRVGDATDEAHLVRLVGLPVEAAVRPRETVPAAHFDKTLQDGGCHTCHVIFLVMKFRFTNSSYKLLRNATDQRRFVGHAALDYGQCLVSLLSYRGRRNVTVLSPLAYRTTGTNLPLRLALP